MSDKIKKSVQLDNGWTAHLIADPPYDDIVRVISPWGEHTNLVKNETTDGTNILWLYFATLLNQAMQPSVHVPFMSYPTQVIPGVGQVTLTSTVPPLNKELGNVG